MLDVLAEKPGRIVFHQADSCGKGITAIPCTEGNLLISGIRKPLEEPFATTGEGLLQLHAVVCRLDAYAGEARLHQVFEGHGGARVVDLAVAEGVKHLHAAGGPLLHVMR